MNRPAILITGASGYLAHRLVPIAATYGDVLGVARKAQSVFAPATPVELDLTDSQALAVAIKSAKPQIIIHAAAVNPGGGEQEMELVNHRAAETIATAAKQLGSRLIMVSTDTVHRGDNAPYGDNAMPDPVNAYGSTKAAGEGVVLDIYPDSLVARTSLIYGLSKIDRGTDGFRRRLQKSEALVLFDDVLRQPVTADHLSTALCELATKHIDVSGTMNLVGDEVLSRADFGVEMLKHWQIDTKGLLSTRSGRGIEGLPIDLRCTAEIAGSLGLRLPGVSEVLAQQS